MKKFFKNLWKKIAGLFGKKNGKSNKNVELSWVYGGFNGSKAKEDSNVVISDFTLDKRGMKIKWVKGMSAWGYDRSDPSGIACVFYYDQNAKKYLGGKFEYISTSRSIREWKNIKDKYHGWNYDKFINAKQFAFCVVSGDGKKRTNIVTTKI